MNKINKLQTNSFHSLFSIWLPLSAKLDCSWSSILSAFSQPFPGTTFFFDSWNSWMLPSKGMTFLFLPFSILFEDCFNKCSVFPFFSIFQYKISQQNYYHLHDLNGRCLSYSIHSSVTFIECFFASSPAVVNLYFEACVMILLRYSGYTVFSISKKYLRQGPLSSR